MVGQQQQQQQYLSVVTEYKSLLANSKDMPMPIAAVRALRSFASSYPANTISEFVVAVSGAATALESSTRNNISLSAGCQKFLQWARAMRDKDLTDFRTSLIKQSDRFLSEAEGYRDTIAELGVPFIRDGAIVLVHSYSRVVMHLLHRAAVEYRRRFKVYVTESRPTENGVRAMRALRALGIPCTIVLDTAVGSVIDRVDLVLVGAEGVVETGGLVNQIGTYQIAIVAQAAGKPLYAVAESYKFVRLFPLDQQDLPTNTPDTLAFRDPAPTNASILASTPQFSIWSSSASKTPALQPANTVCDAIEDHIDGSAGGNGSEEKDEDEEKEDYVAYNPIVDYTPPRYITLLFTDQGVFTPSSVSDELIKANIQ